MQNLEEKIAKKAVKTAFLPILTVLLPIGAAIGLFFLFFFIIMGVFSDSDLDAEMDFGDGKTGLLSEEVLKHQSTVREYAEKYAVEEHVYLILAIMMQESGGKGDDPMQSSESYCGSVGCITDAVVSIEQGVKYFSEALDKAKGDIKLALQSYNFGTGFVDYALENADGYTLQVAIDFSAMKYEELKHTGDYSCVRPEAVTYNACYGDIFYVDAVMAYFNDPTGDGSYVMPLDYMYITSYYGHRVLQRGPDFHEGLDLRCTEGKSRIFVMADGLVTESNYSYGLGNYVRVDHLNGVETRYLHMNNNTVKQGDDVKAGQQIGFCGNTGASEAPHLHLDVFDNGDRVDPEAFFDWYHIEGKGR